LKLIIIQDQHSLTVVPIAEECVSRYLSTLLDVNTLIRLLFILTLRSVSSSSFYITLCLWRRNGKTGSGFRTHSSAH